MNDAVPARPLTFLRLAALAPWPLGGAVLLAILSAALALVPFLLLHRIAVALVADPPDTAVNRLEIGTLDRRGKGTPLRW